MNILVKSVSYIGIIDNSLSTNIEDSISPYKKVEFDGELSVPSYLKLEKLINKPYNKRREKIFLKRNNKKMAELIDIERMKYTAAYKSIIIEGVIELLPML